MAAAITELQAVFTANITGLQAGAKQATEEIKSVEDGAKAVGEVGESSGKVLGSALGKVATEAKHLAPLLGEAGGEAVRFGAHLATAARSATEGLIELIGVGGTIGVGIAAAALAGGAALLIFSNRTRQAAENAALAKGTVQGLKDEIKKLEVVAAAAEKQRVLLEAGVGRAKGPTGLTRKDDINAARDTEETAKLAVARAKLLEIDKEFAEAERRIALAQAAGAEGVEILTSHYEAAKKAREEANAVDGVSARQLTQLIAREREAKIVLDAMTEGQKSSDEQRKKAIRFIDDQHKATARLSAEEEREAKRLAAQLKAKELSLENFRKAFEVTGADIINTVKGISDSIANGIGHAVAQVVVYGASLQQTLAALLKSIAAQIIESLIAIGIQELIFAAIGKTVAASQASAETAKNATIAFGAAFAATEVASIETGPISVVAATAAGLAASAALIAGAIGAGIAGGAAGAGVVAAAKGGYFTRPTLALIGEAGPEFAIPERKLNGLTSDRPMVMHNHLYIDGKEITAVTTKGMPSFLRRHGVKGI